VKLAVLGVVAAGMLLLLLGLGLRVATRWVVEPAGGPPDHVYRRDAVRALAEHEREPDAARPADAMDR
jgi:hypothetical protein